MCNTYVCECRNSKILFENVIMFVSQKKRENLDFKMWCLTKKVENDKRAYTLSLPQWEGEQWDISIRVLKALKPKLRVNICSERVKT